MRMNTLLKNKRTLIKYSLIIPSLGVAMIIGLSWQMNKAGTHPIMTVHDTPLTADTALKNNLNILVDTRLQPSFDKLRILFLQRYPDIDFNITYQDNKTLTATLQDLSTSSNHNSTTNTNISPYQLVFGEWMDERMDKWLSKQIQADDLGNHTTHDTSDKQEHIPSAFVYAKQTQPSAQHDDNTHLLTAYILKADDTALYFRDFLLSSSAQDVFIDTGLHSIEPYQNLSSDFFQSK